MDKERLGSIVSALRCCELTYLERQFVRRVKEYFEENGELTDQQESILEGIYRGKIRWMRKSKQREESQTVNRGS